ncbi:hypothetical protein [Sphingorhabdus contaminans]|uniref:hypothetical protein n=1 Tax=Sphingorhabdus contaminans TaxID=1343899 RepID=UPI003D2DE655
MTPNIDIVGHFFNYRYRDADNYKAEGRILILGTLEDQDRGLIQSKMASEQFFVAEQVNVPSLYHKLYVYDDFPSSSDHSWHEFDSFQELEGAPDIIEGDHMVSAKTFLDAFKSVDIWKPELSVNFNR